jgi:hypothetical protein
MELPGTGGMKFENENDLLWLHPRELNGPTVQHSHSDGSFWNN